jgi:hypothetical protein
MKNIKIFEDYEEYMKSMKILEKLPVIFEILENI